MVFLNELVFYFDNPVRLIDVWEDSEFCNIKQAVHNLRKLNG